MTRLDTTKVVGLIANLSDHGIELPAGDAAAINSVKRTTASAASFTVLKAPDALPKLAEIRQLHLNTV